MSLPLEKVSPSVRKEYLRSMGEINLLRKRGHELRQQALLDPSRVGGMLTREMHKAEHAVLKELYPDLAGGSPKDRQQAWRKFLRTDIGADFRPSFYQQRYY